MNAFSKLWLLIRKNWKLQRRSPATNIFELVLPLAFALLTVFAVRAFESKHVPSTNFTSFEVSGTWRDFLENVDNKTLGGHNFKPQIIYYAPATTATDKVAALIEKRFQNISLFGFASEDDLVKNISKQLENDTQHMYYGGIIFDKGFADGTAKENVLYKLRLPSYVGGTNQVEVGWETANAYNDFIAPGPRAKFEDTGGYPYYWDRGFLTLQRATDAAITEFLNPGQNLDASVRLQKFSYEAYIDNKGYRQVLQSLLPVVILYGFMITVGFVARTIVEEKELKLKEYMRVMGLSNTMHFLSHFLVKYLKFMIVVAAMMVMFFVSFGHAPVFSFVHPLIFLIFILLHIAGVIWFAFLCSAPFQEAKTGAIAASLGFILPSVIGQAWLGNVQGLSVAVKLPLSLFVPLAATFSSQILADYEASGTALDFGNIGTPMTPNDLSMLTLLIIYVIDILLYAALTGYLDAMFPGETGVKQPPWFPCMPSYWFPKSGKSDNTNGEFQRINSVIESGQSIEPDPPGLRPNVSVRKLTRHFGRGSSRFTAVNELSVRMFPGQVFALLGHNGAGKSTTMSMLTGLLSPSSGTAVIKGNDIRDGLSKIRKHVGLCPQHNILFKELTVDEHLRFFVQLKGRDYDEREAAELLETLSLSDKRGERAGRLSGGMQRKLSLVIALIGGSEVVLLDEPTSGMDASARHDAWKLLQAEKANRTILLTTHYMEEADLLGDRIGILAHGQLQCCGSSIFLKHLYGAGYHVTVVFGQRASGAHQAMQADGVLAFIRKHVSDAQLETSGGQEATYLLPATDRHSFSSLFGDLESNQSSLDVSSFGVSVTTMEEVFLKVGDLADQKMMEKSASSHDLNQPVNGGDHVGYQNPVFVPDGHDKAPIFSETDLTSPRRLSGVALYLQQYKAMLLKRFKHSLRSPWVVLRQLIIPCVFLAVQLISIKAIPPTLRAAEGALSLTLKPFEDTMVSIMNETADPFYRKFMNSYIDNLKQEDASVQFNAIPFGTSMESFILGVYGDHQAKWVDKHYIFGAGFESSNGNSTVFAYFNGQPFHTPAITLNLVDNALLGAATPASGKRRQIETVNHPLPPIATNSVGQNDWVGPVLGMLIAMFLTIAMSVAGAHFVMFLVAERTMKSKHIQYLSGANPFAFWHAVATWDGVLYVLPCCVILILLTLFDVKFLIADGAIFITALVLASFGFAALPFIYLVSFIFQKDSTAFTVITFFGMIMGTVPIVINGIGPLVGWKTLLTWMNLLLPPIDPWYNLGGAISTFYMSQFIHDQCEPLLPLCKFLPSNSSASFCCGDQAAFASFPLQFSDPGIGRYILCLIVQGVVFYVILYFIESGMFRSVLYQLGAKRRPAETEESSVAGISDDDVLAERRAVRNMARGDAVVLARQLTKDYGKVRAVDRLSFAVRREECFGLLGVNGAGKTSTFQMITGENMITAGDAILNGTDVRGNWREAGDVGYCPQYEALLGKLTGEETVAMFCRIKGIPESDVPTVARNTLKAVGIDKYADRLVENFSGGNKRRLSLAVAMVGAPKLLLLDEPTTGVDPKARRSVWDILLRTRHHGTAIVLTSHSMEECEALCTRVGIMVAGQFRCMGPPQHIKSKFGLGFGLQLKLPHLDAVAAAIDRIAQIFPHSRLKEQHHTLLIYELESTDKTKWSTLFATLEGLVDELGIVDYSLSQPTLEQVFLEFSRTA